MEELAPLAEALKVSFEIVKMTVEFLFTTPGIRLFVWVPLIGLIAKTAISIFRRD